MRQRESLIPLIRQTVMLAIICLMPAAVNGSILHMETVKIPLSGKGSMPKGVSWSDNLTFAADGLTPKKQGATRVWVQSHQFPVGLSWRPPGAMTITVTLKGKSLKNIPFNMFVRYGCDGEHWSTWYTIPALADPDAADQKKFRYSLIIPWVARRAYHELMPQWRKTDPEWASDEDAYCRWLAKEKPDFFARHFPFIGYAQLRLEHPGSVEKVVLSGIEAQISWSVGGMHTRPKSGKEPDMQKKWHFDIRALTKSPSQQ